MEKYVIYGYKQGADYDDLNRDVDPSKQEISGEDGRVLSRLYDTTDKEEAKKIMRNGGFIKDGEWYVAVQGATERAG